MLDWPWCPLWFSARLLGYDFGSDCRVDEIPVTEFVQDIWPFFKNGYLREMVEPPWTSGFVDLIRVCERLEREELKQQARAQESEIESMLGKVTARWSQLG